MDSTRPLTSCPGALHSNNGMVKEMSFSTTAWRSLRPRPCQGKLPPKALSMVDEISSSDMGLEPSATLSSLVKRRTRWRPNTILSSADRPRPMRAAISVNSPSFSSEARCPSSPPSATGPRRSRTHSRTLINPLALNSYKKLMSLIALRRTKSSRHILPNGSNVLIACCTSFITSALFAICSSTCAPSFIRVSIPVTTRSSSKILPSTALMVLSIFSSSSRSFTFCSPWSLRRSRRRFSTSGFSSCMMRLMLWL
mmetsp:Transcript_19505/g.56124  ORF Transcript_19505/g.56124 Transcript_19505/m.56124 type:complete len:254 (+) Transcript_19505:585-1346(+)